MKMKNIFALALFSITLSSCNAKKLESKNFTIINSENQKVIINVEIAKTDEQRAHGLMGRKKIPSGTGMFFYFEKDQFLAFWMKNTAVPLSIAYIDKNGIIRDILDMTPFSLSPVSSTCSVRYALEVPKGWFAANKIKVGDKIELFF